MDGKKRERVNTEIQMDHNFYISLKGLYTYIHIETKNIHIKQ